MAPPPEKRPDTPITMIPPKRMAFAVQHPPASARADASEPFNPASRVSERRDAALDRPLGSSAMPAPRSSLPGREIARMKALATKTRSVLLGAGQHDPAATTSGE